jgi:8-oxo-dGTP diphosphatase
MTHAAFAVILKDNQVLLVMPPDWVSQFSGHWNFPGGVVENGESPEEGVKREVLEETNIICDIKEQLATDHNEKFNTSIAIYKAAYVSGEVKIQEQEISKAQWFTIEDAICQPLAFDIKKVLLKLVEQLK